MTRPGASHSRAANSEHSTASGTNPMRATRVPRRSALLDRAIAASSGKGARAGRSGDPIGQRWS